MIVDAHMHVWERIDGCICNETPVKPVVNGRIKVGEKEFMGMPAVMLDCAVRCEHAIAEFDAAGVDLGVVVQDYMDGEQNDYLLREMHRWPGRFFVHGLPDYWNTDMAYEQAVELFSRGFRGIKLPASHLVSKVKLDDERLMPIWERMEQNSFVLAVDLSSEMSQVIEMERILDHFPLLKVAIGHFGLPNRNGWPHQLRLARHQNVYLETGGIVWLFRHEDKSFPGAIQAILTAKKEVGIEKLMWGSDFPRTTLDLTYFQTLSFLRLTDALTEHEKQLLLGENAKVLYGLEEAVQSRTPVELITSL